MEEVAVYKVADAKSFTKSSFTACSAAALAGLHYNGVDPASMNGQVDSDPWWLDYGHLTLAGFTLSLFLLGYARGWSRAPMLLLGTLALINLVCAGTLHHRCKWASIIADPELPCFRRGLVLDMGAGTGRSSIMFLEAIS